MLHVFIAPTADRAEARQTAHSLLRRAYVSLCGGDFPELERTGQGKPFFRQGGPEFSLAHTGHMAVCAISDSPVGADAEDLRPLRPRAAQLTMNPPEVAWLAAQPDWDRAFLTLWTAKEAWGKMQGRGLDWRPKAICLRFERGAPAPPDKLARFETREVGGVILTVCTANIEPPVWHDSI